MRSELSLQPHLAPYLMTWLVDRLHVVLLMLSMVSKSSWITKIWVTRQVSSIYGRRKMQCSQKSVLRSQLLSEMKSPRLEVTEDMSCVVPMRSAAMGKSHVGRADLIVSRLRLFWIASSTKTTLCRQSRAHRRTTAMSQVQYPPCHRRLCVSKKSPQATTLMFCRQLRVKFKNLLLQISFCRWSTGRSPIATSSLPRSIVETCSRRYRAKRSRQLSAATV